MSGAWLASYIGLWSLVLVQTILFVALLRQVGVLHTRIGPRGAMGDEKPAAGDQLPQTVFRTLDDQPFTFAASSLEKTLLALFVSPGCVVCKDVMPGFRALSRESRKGLETVLAIGTEESEARQYAREHRMRTAVVGDAGILRQFEIPSTPFAVTIDSEGKVIAGGLVNNLEQVESLLVDLHKHEVELDAAEEAAAASTDGKEAKWEKASIK
jgi:methylamine dehydrogenase accessory protein MauD